MSASTPVPGPVVALKPSITSHTRSVSLFVTVWTASAANTTGLSTPLNAMRARSPGAYTFVLFATTMTDRPSVIVWYAAAVPSAVSVGRSAPPRPQWATTLVIEPESLTRPA